MFCLNIRWILKYFRIHVLGFIPCMSVIILLPIQLPDDDMLIQLHMYQPYNYFHRSFSQIGSFISTFYLFFIFSFLWYQLLGKPLLIPHMRTRAHAHTFHPNTWKKISDFFFLNALIFCFVFYLFDFRAWPAPTRIFLS